MGKPEKLFSKIKIGTMELKNRIAMGEIAVEGRDGYVPQRAIDFYVERARGGAGLVMTGGITIDVSGLQSKYQARVDDDKYIPQLSKLAQAIHEASPGVRAGVQLWHVGRQMRVFDWDAMPGVTPVAPSPIKYAWGVIPHELTTEEVVYLVRQFIEAARRTKDAGFDCVTLHGAHGYLIHQFLSPYTNKRTDKYGGNLENRTRFAVEIIQGVKQRCGQDFPVLIKINAEDYVKAEEQVTLEYAKAIAPLLEKSGVDEIHVSAGQHESYFSATIGLYIAPRGTFADFAAEIKKVVNIPVGAINRINDPLVAERILQEEKADIIWMARPLIADPELPIKAAEGRLDEIRTCIGCCACIDMLRQGWGKDWKCAINPQAQRERAFQISRTLRPRKVLVIGGGPAGIEAARVAALMGHDVTLWEKDDRLGGQVILASIPPSKDEFSNLIRYFSTQLKKLQVKVELEKEATVTSVREMNPDAVIIATGSSSLVPPIPGVDRSNVVTARDVLSGTVGVRGRVVVIGGGEVGMETAQFLLGKAERVTLVEMLPELGEGMVRRVFDYIHNELAQHGAEMLTNTKVEEIADAGIVIVDNGGRKRVIEADTMVLASGAKSNRALLEALEGVVPEVYLAGDCLYPGNIMSAIHQGSMVARMLD